MSDDCIKGWVIVYLTLMYFHDSGRNAILNPGMSLDRQSLPCPDTNPSNYFQCFLKCIINAPSVAIISWFGFPLCDRLQQDDTSPGSRYCIPGNHAAPFMCATVQYVYGRGGGYAAGRVQEGPVGGSFDHLP